MNSFLATVLSNVIAAGLLAVLVFGVSLGVRRPALVHGLWLIVLLKLITPPVFTFTLERSARVEPPGATRVLDASPARGAMVLGARDAASASALPADEGLEAPVPHGTEKPGFSPAPVSLPTIPWTTLALVVWIGGSTSWLALLVIRLGRFRKLLRSGGAAPEWLEAETQTLARRLGLSRVPQLSVVPGAVSPMIFAFGSLPRI